MKWLADENFDNDIIRGVLRRAPAVDIVRAQDLEIRGQDDLVLLAWATRNRRVLLTHDLSTMVPAMREQLRQTSQCAPIVLVSASLPVGGVIENILVLDSHAVPSDWASGVIYLPLR